MNRPCHRITVIQTRTMRSTEVWFEDRRSMEAKFSLIDEYNLAGISWWNIMSRFPEGTEELRERFTVIKV